MVREFAKEVKTVQDRSGSEEGQDLLQGIEKGKGRPGKPGHGSWIYNATKDDLIAVLDNLPYGVAILRSAFGQVLYVNDQIIATLGYSLSDTHTTRAMFKKTLPDRKARSEASKSRRQVVRSGSGVMIRQYLCRDGKIRIFENNTVVLRKNLIVNMWTDVTGREEAKARLKESESRFRSFFENCSDAYLLFSSERVVNCNEAAWRMLGYNDREKIMSATLESLSPEKQPDGVPSSLRAKSLFRTALRKGSYRCEWTALRSDGKEVPLEVSITAIALKDKALLFASFRDVTEWKEAQRALLRAKNDLEKRVKERTSELANLNKRLLREVEARKKTEREVKRSREELRNLSEHLQQAREEERAHAAREVHDQLGQSLSAVAIDLACLRGRLATGGDDWLREEVREIEGRIGDTMRSVREICTKLRPSILDDFGLPMAVKWHLREFQERTGIDCTVTIDEEIPHHKDLDLVIFRIYQEAMTNILRHASATRVAVTLKLHKGNLVLEVKDNGKGISPEQIVSPLSLGILGMRERVRFWKGTSMLNGAPDKGTTIKVSVPLHPAKKRSKESVLRSSRNKDWWTQ